MSASYRRDTLLRVVPIVSSSESVLNIGILDLNVVALEKLVLQFIHGVAALRDIDRDFGGVQLHVIVAHFLRQQVLQLENPEHACRVDLLTQFLSQ